MLHQRQIRQCAHRQGQLRARPALETLEDRTLLASNIFVANAGNDSSGQGTLSSPFATLGKAVNFANPGDTIILRGGTYNGGVIIKDPNITIKSYDGEWAKISSSNTNSAVPATIRFDIDAWNCKLQRLEIMGGYYYSVMTLSNWDSGVTHEYGASNLTIEDSKLHDSGRDVIKITPGSNDVVIRRCEIYNSGRRDASNAEGIDNVNGDRMIVQDSYIHDIATTGVYPKGGASNSIIERNLFNNIAQVGIMVGGDTDVEWFDNGNTQYYESIDTIVRNNIVMNTQMAGIGLYAALRPQIYNNTLVNVGISSQGAVLFTAVDHYVPPNFTSYIRTPNTDVMFVNNIVTQSTSSTRPMFNIRDGGLNGTLTLNNNRYHDAGGAAQFWDERAGRTYYGGLAGWRTTLNAEANSSEGNPLLDSSQHLTSSSPAINAGRSVTNPGLDYDGGTKTGTLDIGADEYGAGTPLLVPPPAGTIGTGGGSGSSNRAPTAGNDSATTAEDAAVNISVLSNDGDLDGDTLTISGFTQPAHGTVTNNGNGTLHLAPSANWNGSDSFTYTISDGKGGTATATVSLTITPVNDNPDAVNDSASTTENMPVTITVKTNDSDVDGDPLTVTVFTSPTHGSALVNGNGEITYTPGTGFNGSDSFTYRVNDGKGGIDTASVSINVNAINDPPNAGNDSASTPEDIGVNISVLGNDSDPDGDTLTISSFSQPAHGAVTNNGNGTLRFVPAANWNGGDSFTYTISDGEGGTDTASVSLTVTPVNDAPDAVNDSAATSEDTPVTITVKTNDSDIDGDPLTISLITNPANGSALANANGTITYTPAAGFNGSDGFVYRVNDGKGGTDTATVSVTVSPVNDPPAAGNDSASTPEDTGVSISVLSNDSDPDGDALTISGFTQPAHGAVTNNGNGTLRFVPSANRNGSDSFTYTVSDGRGGSDTATVSLTVTPVNDVPNAVNDSVTTDEDTPVTISVKSNDSDVDGDTLTVSIASNPSNGSVFVNGNGTITYTPNNGYSGSESFAYTLNDGKGGTDTATVSLTVNAINHAPDAMNDTAVTTQGVPVVVTVKANDTDPDGDALSVQLGNEPTSGSAVVNANGTVTYTPNTGFTGNDSFTYRVDDGRGGTDTASVSVTVNSSSPDGTVGFEPDPWNPSQQALVIRGTGARDIIHVRPKNDRKQVSVLFNYSSRGKFWINQFSRIIIEGKAGDDWLEINSGVSKSAQLRGGQGNDTLLGGAGKDLLLGGDGADRLEGRNGADVLIGGSHADQLWGGAYGVTSSLDRDDLLIGGTTRHDNNDEALHFICDEWGSNETYGSRVAALNGGDRDLPVLDTSTVNNDDAGDQIYGNAGLDWFFCNEPQDRVIDQVGGERIN